MLDHIGLQYPDKDKAEIFFSKILGLPKIRDFTISAELGETIFGMKKNIDVAVYGNDKIKFEIFFTKDKIRYIYEHLCWVAPNKEEFISCCKSNGIDPIIVKKGDKDLLFIRDFSGYLYEIKEG
ncbi:MAG: VOC family protein [Candidatus Thermoplasmatota archaeon]